MRTYVVAAVAATALGACKGKPTNHKPDEPAATGGSGTSMGKVVPQPGSNVAPDIVLPHSDGSAPKQSAAVSADKLTALSALQFPGFLRDVQKATATSLEVHHKTESRPRILATVFVEPCGTTCTPMDLDAWKAKGDILKQYLAPDLRSLIDTHFDVGATTLDGVPAIFTYQLAQTLAVDEDGNHSGAFSDAYVLYFNDGTNQIHVVAEYKDDAMKTKEAMAANVPREDLEHVAKAFADVYTHAW